MRATFNQKELALVRRATEARKAADFFYRARRGLGKGKNKQGFPGPTADDVLRDGGVLFSEDPQLYGLFEREVRKLATGVDEYEDGARPERVAKPIKELLK